MIRIIGPVYLLFRMKEYVLRKAQELHLDGPVQEKLVKIRLDILDTQIQAGLNLS